MQVHQIVHKASSRSRSCQLQQQKRNSHLSLCTISVLYKEEVLCRTSCRLRTTHWSFKKELEPQMITLWVITADVTEAHTESKALLINTKQERHKMQSRKQKMSLTSHQEEVDQIYCNHWQHTSSRQAPRLKEHNVYTSQIKWCCAGVRPPTSQMVCGWLEWMAEQQPRENSNSVPSNFVAEWDCVYERL